MNNSITVLGIHDGHNSGAAIVRDGKVMAAISEERLNNIKNFSGLPVLAIRKVITISGINPTEIDQIYIGCLVRVGAPYADKNILAKFQVELAPYLHSHIFARTYVSLLHKLRNNRTLNECFKSLGLADKPVVYIDHHLSHAACAYYQRPWPGDALILTLDGSGDGLCATVSVGKGSAIKRISETVFYHSPSNNLYSEITGFLGMKRWEHEYKIMGLAPYGKDDGLVEEFKKLVRINPGNPLEFENTSGAYLYNMTKKLSKILTGRRFDNIAWATQKYFEDLLVSWVTNAVSRTGITDIVFSGGSFLNVKANKAIREMPIVGKTFFYPAADDGGTPVGAALEGYVRLCEKNNVTAKFYPLQDLYYGQTFTDDNIKVIIGKTRWKSKTKYFSTGIEKIIARLLSEGKIVARFAGRDEWGPRSLGNRSILADPRNLKVIARLNFAIKQRDFWMPFAISIIEKDAKIYFKDAKVSKFMIEAFDTKDKGEEIIAGIHPYDRTCRPQTVGEDNKSYYSILCEFKKITGVSGILNTSFNLHGFPIVGTPEVAIETFTQSGLDGLAIGNWLIIK